jgi:hypothetical protein
MHNGQSRLQYFGSFWLFLIFLSFLICDEKRLGEGLKLELCCAPHNRANIIFSPFRETTAGSLFGGIATFIVLDIEDVSHNYKTK